MQHNVRGRGGAVSPIDGPLPDGIVGERPIEMIASGGPGSPGPVSGVSSDQLWRAAVFAAREAALTAAELRRSLEARRAGRGGE